MIRIGVYSLKQDRFIRHCLTRKADIFLSHLWHFENPKESFFWEYQYTFVLYCLRRTMHFLQGWSKSPPIWVLPMEWIWKYPWTKVKAECWYRPYKVKIQNTILLHLFIVRALRSRSWKSYRFLVRAQLHMTKNLSTNPRRTLNEYSTKNFTSLAKKTFSSKTQTFKI